MTVAPASADCHAVQRLASVDGALDAAHITKTDSGHDFYLYTPALVVDSIREVVADLR